MANEAVVQRAFEKQNSQGANSTSSVLVSSDAAKQAALRRERAETDLQFFLDEIK